MLCFVFSQLSIDSTTAKFDAYRWQNPYFIRPTIYTPITIHCESNAKLDWAKSPLRAFARSEKLESSSDRSLFYSDSLRYIKSYIWPRAQYFVCKHQKPFETVKNDSMSGIGIEFNKVCNTFAFIRATVPLNRLWSYICIPIRWLLANGRAITVIMEPLPIIMDSILPWTFGANKLVGYGLSGFWTSPNWVIIQKPNSYSAAYQVSFLNV